MVIESSLPIGSSAPRADGINKVTGAAKYTSDIRLPGAIWGKTLRSPFSYAKILKIDTSAAKALPGVHAVLTGTEIGDASYGRRIVDVPVLAQNVVRFIGEQVAAVAADDEDIAQRAIDLIDVEYEELTPILSTDEAIKSSAPILHPDVIGYQGLPEPLSEASNIFHSITWGKGDVDKGFESSDLIIENTFTTPTVHQAYMEPHCCLVDIDNEGRAQVWAPVKTPYTIKNQVAQAVNLTPDQVLINPVTIGGDFGGKGSPMNIPLCYFLAKASGRPVKMIFDYLEEFMAGNPRHPSKIKVKTGVLKDGTIMAHQADLVFDSGGYAGYKPLGFLPGASGAAGPYKIANAKITSSMVYTNNIPCGHMRGPGEPQAVFAIESQIDCIARALGIDPFDYRKMNLITEDDQTPIGKTFKDVRAVETLESAADTANYFSKKASGIGRGIAIAERSPGGGETYAWVALEKDGSVTVSTTIFEQGSGTYTTLQQVVAEELSLPLDRVAYRVWDTDKVPFDTGIGGSRGTRVGTLAAYEAVQAIKESLYSCASELLGWPVKSMSIVGDTIVRTDTNDSYLWSSLIEKNGEPLIGTSHVDDKESAPVTSFTCQIAEVSVDAETGEVKLLKITTAHDTGKIINPMGHQGQINGGIQHGIGYALMEELAIEDGRVTTLSFADYKIPTTADMPELRTVILESDSGVGPYNIRGIGENPNAPTAAAIANAVEDACGVRVVNLPVTAEKVYYALQRSKD